MLIKLKIGIVIIGYYCVISIIPFAFGLKTTSFSLSSPFEKQKPQRPSKNSRQNSASHRVSNPKIKSSVNRIPSNSQNVVDIYVDSNYGGYSDSNPLQLPTNDAIRIIDPPTFFEEQKKLYQRNPLKQINQYNAPSKKSRRPAPSPLFLQNQPPEEFHYKGPEFFPYQGIKPQIYANNEEQSIIVNEERQKPERQKFQRGKLERSKSERRKPERERPERERPERDNVERPQKPPLTYAGIQTPNSKSIRNQIQSLKDKQILQFEEEDDERPARPVDSRKRHPSQRRKPRPQNDDEERPLGYEVFRDTERKVKDALGIRETRPKSSYRGTDSSELIGDYVPKEEKAPFVPYQMLASVRHTNRISHQPKPKDLNPRASSRLKTQQRHTVYSEQGFEDNEYDHGDEERHAQHGDKNRQRYHKRTRRKRHIVTDQSDDVVENVKELPMILTLTDSNGKNISGRALFDHISKLIGKSPKLVSDDSVNTPESDSVLLRPEDLGKLINRSNLGNNKKLRKKFNKFPLKKIDPSVIPDQSAIKYAEKLENFNESPYEKKGTNIDCEIIEPDFEQKGKSKKLGQLGDKLECMKGKFFGKDPLGNPFFKEPIIISDTDKIESNDQDKYKMQTYRSPFLELVYTDVMKTIKTSLVAEQEMNSNDNDDGEINEDQIETGTKITESRSLNSNNPLQDLLPIFNAAKFVPNIYMIRPDGKIYGIKVRSPESDASIVKQEQHDNHNTKNNNTKYLKKVKVKVKVNKKPLITDSKVKNEKIQFQRPAKIKLPAIVSKIKPVNPKLLLKTTTASDSTNKPVYYRPTNRQPAPVTEDVNE